MKGLGYGQGYQYAHDLEGKIADMQCLPDNLRDRTYYHPTNEGVEKRIRERMEEIKRRRLQAGKPDFPMRKKNRVPQLLRVLCERAKNFRLVPASPRTK